ncbi:uncharacterized protein METZ01_LOCUS484844, partial [marine metagenome]
VLTSDSIQQKQQAICDNIPVKIQPVLNKTKHLGYSPADQYSGCLLNSRVARMTSQSYAGAITPSSTIPTEQYIAFEPRLPRSIIPPTVST